MKIIEIKELENGGHRNQELIGVDFTELPEGWAAIPEEMELPDTYPFVHIKTKDGVVTAMTAGELPEPTERPEPEPAENERLRADLDYLAALQGVTL